MSNYIFPKDKHRESLSLKDIQNFGPQTEEGEASETSSPPLSTPQTPFQWRSHCPPQRLSPT